MAAIDNATDSKDAKTMKIIKTIANPKLSSPLEESKTKLDINIAIAAMDQLLTQNH
jgi:hypothetical protein